MKSGALKLAATLAVIAAVWLIALPHLAGRPRMSARLQWLQQNQIDPAAMYYTELEMMKPILTRHAIQQRRKPQD